MHATSSAHSRAQITARDLCVERGGIPVISGLNLTIHEGSRIAIVGENGRGKSTLLSALAGLRPASAGTLLRHGRIGTAEQEMPAAGDRTVGDAVEFAIRDSLDALAALDTAAAAMTVGGSAAERARSEDAYAAALDTATRLDAWDADRRVTVALEALGAETDRARALRELSVGQRYRVRLACLLGGDAQLLLLDEPTNHLDAAALDALAAALRTRSGGVALVSHDRRLLQETAETFVDLDPTADGAPRVYGGGYAGWLAGKRADRARWEQASAEQSDTADRLRHQLDVAQQRLVSGWKPPKGTGKHQRATRAPGLVQSVRRRQSELEAHAVAAPEPPLRFAAPDYRVETPGRLLAAERVSLEPRLPTPISCALSAGDRLLVQGPNGAGKSTLLGILSGALAPASGRVMRRAGVRIAALAQESRVAEAGPESAAERYRRYADRLVARNELPETRIVPLAALGLLDAEERRAPVRELSIGQRRRLDLALTLLAQPEVLILDEPTNHLSIPLIDELTAALHEIPAAVIVSTHDRSVLQDLARWDCVVLPGWKAA
ncbi:ATP-binding cassette domain-containing protein [Leucobacter triazinivorans]|uniref:ABC-F family ATP-binding cassette domain-containing protein n=1 Tax=Leucobacter triazinivorans TaxID=1784719 RepID=A0A4P6KBN3_9MICO|nr:ATP-binding cassette domain-containing protein [Leucobacter triazinivorans]QBE47542.1 ABC-F family ATP-binding cassette domain-containing protein [Leucobacter triazinivorans]